MSNSLLCVCVCVRTDATNPMQIMFSVLRGSRPDTGLDYLPEDIPSRDTLINLLTSGWSANPDERPSFLRKALSPHPVTPPPPHPPILPLPFTPPPAFSGV